MDVTDENSVRNAVERIESAGPIDVLINNAGYVYWGPVEEVSIEEAKKLFEVDYFGQLRVIKAVLPHMRSRKAGLIINTTSLAAIVGLPFSSHYSAAKSGVERITESLYNELKPFNISVSSLLPGDINTSVDANMIGRHKSGGKLSSTDIGTMVDELPTLKDSSYYDRSKDMWKIFITNHIVAPPPYTVSKKILKIIRSKKPKLHYKSGTFSQAVALPLLKAVLPQKAFMEVLAKAFGV